MKKSLRDSVDIGVAFESALKQGRPETDRNVNTSASIDNLLETARVGNMSKTDRSCKRALKRMLRIDRLLKVVIRPLAFRIRRYLVRELQQEIQRASAAAVQELQSLSGSFSRRFDLIEQHSNATRQELQAMSARFASQFDLIEQHGSAASQELQSLSGSFARRFDLVEQYSNATSQELQSLSGSFANRFDLIEQHSNATSQELQAMSARFVSQFDRIEQHGNDASQELQSLSGSFARQFDRIEQYSSAAARRIAISCGNGATLIRTDVGYVLCGSEDHALLAFLVETGELERGTRLLIQKFLKPGDCFVDVGANIGMHTLAAARTMEGQGEIIAFEPFEPTCRLLERTVWINGFSAMVEIHQAAVSNVSGREALFLGKTSGHHSLFTLGENADVDCPSVEVALVRLDEILPKTQRIDLLKIDAEGAELQVLESTASFFENNKDMAIIVEFGPSHLKRTGVSPEDWLDAFKKFDLHYRVVNEHTGKIENWSIKDLLACDSVNLFFSRSDSKAWERLQE